MQREQETLPQAWERLQEIIKSYPHNGITQQKLARIFYVGVSSINRVSLDVACRGNLMLKPHVGEIKIIEDMCSMK